MKNNRIIGQVLEQMSAFTYRKKTDVDKMLDLKLTRGLLKDIDKELRQPKTSWEEATIRLRNALKQRNQPEDKRKVKDVKIRANERGSVDVIFIYERKTNRRKT